MLSEGVAPKEGRESVREEAGGRRQEGRREEGGSSLEQPVCGSSDQGIKLLRVQTGEGGARFPPSTTAWLSSCLASFL